MGIRCPAVLCLDMEKHPAMAEIGVETQLHRARDAPRKIIRTNVKMTSGANIPYVDVRSRP